MENIIEVLVLYDGRRGPYFITKYEFFGSAMELIDKLREPHARFYKFRSICYDDLDTYEEDKAWYAINTASIPQPFDPKRFEFIDAFDFLWKCGREVFTNV